MNLTTQIGCKLVGWKPEILKGCKEISYATLKRYVAAIVILSIIWGIIGWNFAGNYLAIESWYGKAIASAFFITAIILIERYIILSYGSLAALRIFRILLAVIMAILGATIFDQIIFKNDINIQMKDIRTDQINAEIPKRGRLIDDERKEILENIQKIDNENKELQEEINKLPVIKVKKTTTQRRVVGTEIDKDGKEKPIYAHEITVIEDHLENPKIPQLKKNEEIRQGYVARDTELKDRKLNNIANEVREEYEALPVGFLEELRALYSLLGKDWIVLAFYIVLFLFLMSLELLVILTKGSENCDYELLLRFQFEQRKKQLEALGNQKEFINVDNI